MVTQVSESVPLLLMILIPLLVLDQSETVTGQEIGKALIAQTCNKTEFPADCIIELESDPRSFISNVTGLTRIALEIAATKANHSFTVAQYWVNHQPDYPSWGWAVVCKDNYNGTVFSMEDSLKAFDELQYEKSYQSLKAVNNSVNGCKQLGLESFNDVNTMMSTITRNTMDILHILF